MAGVALEAGGFAVLTGLTAPTYRFRGTAWDAAGNQGTQIVTLTVNDHGPTPPQVNIANPQQGDTITEPLDVTGSVSGVGLTSWYLRLTPTSGGPAIPIASDSRPVSGILGRLDPTLVPDGAYYLLLHADSSGGDDGEEITVNVRGRLKLGDFKISFTDLTVPVAGIPISVRRSYDSLQANSSRDFGYGWRLDLGDAGLQVDFRDGPFPGYGQYLAFRNGDRVILTRPGADPEGFTFLPYNDQVWPISHWHPWFIPDPGVTSRLVVPDVDLDVDPATGVYSAITEQGQVSYNPADPAFSQPPGTPGVYHLITLDGIDNKIDAVSGKLLTLSDRHHNQLTFARSGITSNRVLDGQPLGITIQRDGQQRIESITDPNGHSIVYHYDGHGDLYLVTDRLGQATQFAYDNSTQPSHRLITITDPLNQQPLQVAYNMSADHRLGALTDAAGKMTQLGYNIDSVNHVYKQSITDPTQKTTTLTFDTRGNVSDVVDQARQHTTATYESDFVTSVTQVNADDPTRNQVTTYDYQRDPQTHLITTGLPITVTDPEHKITSYSYNDFGQVQTVTDPLQHTLVNTYDPQTGDLLSVQPPATSPTNYLYDALGDVTSTTFGGATTAYLYDSIGRLTATISPTGVERDTHYDRNGNRTEEDFRWVDPDGVRPPRTLVTSMVYDANDRLTVTIDPETQRTTYVYDALNRVKETDDIYGGVSATKYDKRGLVVEQTTPLRSVTRTVYDDDGRPLYVTDAFFPGGANDPPNGTHNHYDDAGRVDRVERVQALRISVPLQSPDVYTSQVDSVGAVYSTSTTHYNALGQVDSTTDAAQLTTTFQYNGRGLQTLETVVIGGTPYNTRTDYDDAGRATQVTDRAGKMTRTQYDDAGRPTIMTYAYQTSSQMFTQTHYDLQGRKDWQEDEDVPPHRTSFTYDTLGRLQSVIQPQVPDPEQGGTLVSPRTDYTYDVYGNLRRQQDAKGRITLFRYDEYQRQVRRILPGTQASGFSSAASTATTLDAPGQNWTADQWAGGFVRIVAGRGAGQERAVTGNGSSTLTVGAAWDANGIPDASSRYVVTKGDGESSTYNAFGQLAYKLDFKGQKIEYVYAPNLNRVQTKNLYAVGATTPTEHVDYGYDPLGRIQTVTQPNSQQTVYGYDADSRLQTLSTPQGAMTYGYDPATGRHTETTTANSDFVYGYDVFGHLQRVTVNKRDGVMLSTPEQTIYNWDPVGTLNNVQHANGITTVYGYDPRYRVQSVTQQQGAGQLAKYVYTRQNDGKITHVNEYGSNPATVTAALDYIYDALGWLTHEQFNSQGAGGDYTIDYTLDLVGNRKTQQTVTGGHTQRTDWTYDARDRIMQEMFAIDTVNQRTRTFGYDTNGSLTSITSTTGDSANYQYNLENRLVGAQVVRGGTPQSSTYLYNDDGSRVQEGNTRLLVDPNNPTGFTQVMEERDSTSGALLTTYVYGLEPLSFSRPGTPGQPGPSWQYVTDAHSGVRMVVNASGAADATYRYDAFGNLIGTPGSFVNVVQYRGERLDVTLGQYYLRARTYDPATGRFAAIDPVLGSTSSPLTLHRYFYAAADPVNYADASGNEFGLVGSLLGTSFRLAIAGSLLSVGINGINNFALGRSFFDGAAGAAAFGAAALPLAVAFPVVGIVLAGIGIYASGATAWRVFTNPDSTAGQRGAAAFLVGLSVFGAVGAGRSAQARGLWVNARYLETAGLSSANSMSRALDYALYRTNQFKSVLDTMPRQQRNSITIGVGVADDAGGIRHTLIATSEPRGYIRPPMQRLIQAEDIIVRGDGDAEANIVAYAKSRGWNLIGVGATRRICDDCAAHVAVAGATAVTPLRNP